nr:UbiA family prenyltransferase [Halorientalis brevis]
MRRRVVTVASLVRLQTLFTAPPDVVLGAALVVAAGRSVPFTHLVGVIAVSMLVSAGGATLNDAVDAPRDAVANPERPIPRGYLSRWAGFGLGGVLFAAAVLGARAVSPLAAGVTALLVATVVLYDGFLIRTPLGSLGMGTTRGLNVVLGVTAGGTAGLPWPLVVAPVVTGGYAAAVTGMAGRQPDGRHRGPIVVAGLGAAAATVATGWYVAARTPSLFSAATAFALLLAFFLWTARTIVTAYVAPFPAIVTAAGESCVLALVVLEAALAAVTAPLWGLATLAFLVPAVGLARAYPVP